MLDFARTIFAKILSMWLYLLYIPFRLGPITAALPPPPITYDQAKNILRVNVKNKLTAIINRAIPNKRLKNVFKIENAFTTMSLDVHDAFVRAVRESIIIDSHSDLRDMVMDIFIKEKDIQTHGKAVPFKKFVMISVLKFSIYKFFRGDVAELAEDLISGICHDLATELTELWLESKGSTFSKERQNRLFRTLQTLFPNIDVHDQIKNPLCLIIPSFETLWRVLYRLTLQIKTVVDKEEAKSYLLLFRQFLKEPSKQTFTEMKNNISVENTVKEILLCHPPTRSIYRWDEKTKGNVRIDVLKIHKDFMGGEKKFSPQRWAEGQKVPFLSFGYSLLECPAKKLFAPFTLALMAATMFEIFEHYDWGNNQSVKEDVKDNDRNQYDEFLLIETYN